MPITGTKVDRGRAGNTALLVRHSERSRTAHGSLANPDWFVVARQRTTVLLLRRSLVRYRQLSDRTNNRAGSRFRPGGACGEICPCGSAVLRTEPPLWARLDRRAAVHASALCVPRRPWRCAECRNCTARLRLVSEVRTLPFGDQVTKGSRPIRCVFLGKALASVSHQPIGALCIVGIPTG